MFLESGTHGGDWPKVAWGVIELPFSNRTGIFRNDNNQKQHMEFFLICQMIEDIHLQGVVGPVHFKYYISYSPCANCANNFVMLRNAILYLYRCDITIDIVAAAPYKTYRVSCPTCRTRFFYKPNYEERFANMLSLQTLAANKMCVRAFSYQDWTKLAELLGCGVNYYPYPTYANTIIGQTTKHNLRHTRKQADEAADKDFNFILYHPVWNDIEDVTDLSRDELKKIIADAI